VAPFSFEVVRTEIARLDRIDAGRLATLYAGMEAETRKLLKSAGVADREIQFARSCDMRYVGQSHEIRVPVPAIDDDASLGAALRAAFDAEYVRLYHRTNAAADLEAITWRLVAMGPAPRVRLAAPATAGGGYRGERKVWLPEAKGLRPCPVVDRYGLSPGQTIEGPVVIEERESTAVIGPGTVTVDPHLNLRVTLETR
jgi:N-methylhydantoinase A/oxoprolinase/acetone carboxylase beta subunit